MSCMEMSLRKFTIQCGGGRVNGAHNCHQEKDKKKKELEIQRRERLIQTKEGLWMRQSLNRTLKDKQNQ